LSLRGENFLILLQVRGLTSARALRYLLHYINLKIAVCQDIEARWPQSAACHVYPIQFSTFFNQTRNIASSSTKQNSFGSGVDGGAWGESAKSVW